MYFEGTQTSKHCQVLTNVIIIEEFVLCIDFWSMFLLLPRLLDVLHRSLRLTMVFEYCDQVRSPLPLSLPSPSFFITPLNIVT